MDGAELPIARTVQALRAHVAGWRRRGERVALVPTMGALHAGHLALVELARREGRRVVVSLFVNPRQFAPTEDLDRYPRREAEDAALLAQAGADLLYAPSVGEMYGRGGATTVRVGGVSEPLEGAFRPHFFDGVATVVAKLLIQCAPEAAVFGEKDWQQLQVVRRMATDLDLPVEIVAGETVREADGLALSSRNAYLAPAERAAAVALPRVLLSIAAAAADGSDWRAAEVAGRATLTAAGFGPIDYLELRHAETLARFEGEIDGPARVLGTAWLGTTRLIDNVPV